MESAKDVFNTEINCLKALYMSLDESFELFVQKIDGCRGNIVWTGVGKSGHICKKVVATMQSLGIKAIFLNPVDALHGDLGVLSRNDVVIIVSNSGSTKELIDIIPPIKALGVSIFSIVGKSRSPIAVLSDETYCITDAEEAFLGIVPTSSTTNSLVLGDAIAISIAKQRHFTIDEFGLYHPKGQLGKRLTLKVKDVMVKGPENSIILEGATLEQAVFEMCRKSVSAVCVVDKIGKLKGYFTDGDFRRYMSKSGGRLDLTKIDSVMVTKPIYLKSDQLLYDAITETISQHTVSSYPVIDDDNNVVGIVRMVDVVNSGLYK